MHGEGATPILCVLGPLRLIATGSGSELVGAKRRRLAALLVSEDGHPRSHDWLAAHLWDDEGLPRDYVTTVRVYVSRLRRAGVPIETHPAGYALAGAAITDVREFRRRAALGHASSEQGAATALLDALDMWNGSAYEEFVDCERLQSASASLDAERSEVACAAADRVLRDPGSPAADRAVAILEQIVRVDPERDEVVARLALLHHRRGHPSAAEAALSRLEQFVGWLPSCSREVADAIRSGSVPDRFSWQIGSERHEPIDVIPAPVRSLPPRPVHPPLVERSAQLADLALAVHQCGERATVALISGSVGAGKTRLLIEAGHAASADVDVRFGRFEPDFREPLGTLMQAFPSLDQTEIASVDDAEINQRRIVSQTAEAIIDACVRPTVLLLDELHHADSLSLLVLRAVLTATVPPPLVLVATVGSDAPIPESLGVLRDRLRRTQSLVEVRATELTSAGVEELLERLAPGTTATADQVVELTSGNPYLTALIVQHLGGDGDLVSARESSLGAVGDFVRVRLNRLDDQTRSELEMLSVVGVEFELELLESVFDMPTDDAIRRMHQLVDLGLLVDRGTREEVFGFEHELFRRAVYASVDPSRRRDLHERIARSLDGSSRLATHHERAASHWIAAGCADEGAQCLLDAARAAAGGFSFDDAVRLAERGLAVATDTDLGLHADLQHVAARAAADSGRLEEAAARHREAYAAARLAGRDDLIAEAAIGASGSYVPNSYDDARLLRMLAAIRDVAAPAPRSRMLAKMVLLQYGRGARADEWAKEAHRLALSCNDRAALAASISTRCLTSYRPGLERQRLDLAIEGLDVAGHLLTRDPEVTLTVHAVIAGLQLGDFELVHGLIERVERPMAAPLGPLPQWWVLTMRTSLLAATGDLDGADESARDGRAIADRIGVADAAAWFFMQLWSHNHLRGSYGGLVRAFSRQLTGVHVSWRLAAAVELLATGATDQVAALLDEAATDITSLEYDYLYAGTMQVAAIAGDAAGHPIASLARQRLAGYAGLNAVYGSACGYLGQVSAS